tara:strand:+ start:3794 stop:4495 length:702 start_codon:yes stop_codon:yes gene_type:complete
MINLKIGEHTCNIPEQWNEITLNDYKKIYGHINKNQFKEPEEPPRDQHEIDMLENEKRLHSIKLNRKIFSELTGLNEEIINKTHVVEMSNTLSLMSKFLNNDADKVYKETDGKYGFKHKDKMYYFPELKMKSSTFGDFIETAQLEMFIKQNDAGKMSVIAEQMAILCREENEEYDEKLVAKKTKLFGNLTMDIVWNFVFFLKKQMNIWRKHIQTFSKTATEQKTDMQPIIGKS